MTDPSLKGDREDDSRGIWVLRIAALIVGVLIVVNLTQTAGNVVGFFTGDATSERASARPAVEEDPPSIAVATRTVHYDCATARPSLATWVGSYVDRVIPGSASEANRIRNCTRCGKPIEQSKRKKR